MARDYYEVLGITRSADKNEIKQAFRRLAREYHPDVSKHPQAEARFKEINEAYEVLSDEQKRARYDRFGHAGVGGNGFGGAGAGQAGGAAGFGGFEDIFEEFFNSVAGAQRGASRRRGPQPGADRRVDVTISFEESIFGAEREITFERMEVCDVCDGNGSASGSSPTTCTQCNGSGEVRQVQQTFLGSMVRVAPCPRCGGRGEMVENPCTNCKGTGRLRKATTLTVQIPAGVREGLQVQVRGEGDQGERSAPAGNLYVVVHVQEHEYFKRRENDILMDIGINVAQAALGDKIVVPSVDGEVELLIPAGTQTGKIFRMRGRGIPRLRSDGSNSGRGDQLVYIQVEIPATLSEEQRALFEQLAETLGSEVQPQKNGRGFFDRVMDFFAGEQQP
ncbi:MAG: molecular chaperone DnaJ [Burkholderiales bacterium]|nr:molecular chaperone DnaJ [Anaerolineae bacterium]